LSRSNKITNANRTVQKDEIKAKKGTHLRDNSTIKRLAMYKEKPVRDKDGSLIRGAFMSREVDEKVKRIQADRRWFGVSIKLFILSFTFYLFFSIFFYVHLYISPFYLGRIT
jgi:hypothetical protein